MICNLTSQLEQKMNLCCFKLLRVKACLFQLHSLTYANRYREGVVGNAGSEEEEPTGRGKIAMKTSVFSNNILKCFKDGKELQDCD